MELNGNGYEPTCRNKELDTNNDKTQSNIYHAPEDVCKWEIIGEV